MRGLAFFRQIDSFLLGLLALIELVESHSLERLTENTPIELHAEIDTRSAALFGRLLLFGSLFLFALFGCLSRFGLGPLFLTVYGFARHGSLSPGWILVRYVISGTAFGRTA